jgi:multidrug efflux system membrane fusion protein
VTVKSIPLEIGAVGTVQPNESVQIRSQVTNKLKAVHFEKGQDVKVGDPLFTIDARPAKAAKKLAEANLVRDKAEYENAKIEASRKQELYDKKLISDVELKKTLTQAQALAATLAADEAAIQGAKLSVDFSTIKCPINGRTGDLLVNVGNLIRANDAVLVTINQIQPIRVSFSLPQRELPRIMKRMNDKAAGGAPEVRVIIQGDEETPEVGRLVLIDNAVDSSAGSIKMWAEFENTSIRLWPGQLVNVIVTLGDEPNAVCVPTRSVQNGQEGPFVFVVKSDNTVESRPIETNRTFGDDTVVENGLKAKESIVTDGQLRLKPGAKVIIRSKSGAENP